MTIKPILDRVLLKVDEQTSSTKSGIILAGKSQEQPVIANVIARGPGGIINGKEVKMYIHPGDKVIINKYSGSEVHIDGQDYIIVQQSDILAGIFGNTIKPILDRVLLKTVQQQQTVRGIIVASTSKDQPLIANVIARGAGGMVNGKEVKMYVNQNDKVIVNKHAGTEITLDGEEYVIVQQSDILASIF